MGYTIEPVDNLRQTLKSLECDIPTGIAILPENLSECKSVADFIYPDAASDIKKLIRKSDYPYRDITEGKQKYRIQRSADLILPTIFIGEILSNPDVRSFIINLISSYVYDRLKADSNKNIKCEIIFESKKGKIKKLKYEGTIQDFEKLSNLINIK